MGSWLLGIYVVLSVLAVVQGVLVVVQTWEHHRFARSRLAIMRKYPRKGKALLIAPCRGIDVGLARNLHTLFHQDYENYQIRFVVESADDPACAIIRRHMASHPAVSAELLIAGRAEREGQKIHNLRTATIDLPAGVEYLAFVDSDARLRRQWLRALLCRVDGPGVGAVTGYRWFVPSRATLANHLLHSVNSHIAVLFGSRGPGIVWGGSWSIRREQFEDLNIHAAWAGTLSDDFVVSRALRRAGLRVHFEPACMVTSPADVTLAGLLEFVRRQYFLGRWYVPSGWMLAVLVTTFVNAVSLANVVALGAALACGLIELWIPAAFCGVLYALSAFAGLLRQDLALTYFPQLKTKLRTARRFEVWSGPVVALVNWASALGSAMGRSIRWRGIGYTLNPKGTIAVVDRGHVGSWRRAGKTVDRPSSGATFGRDVLPMPGVADPSAGRTSRRRVRRRSA